MVLTINEIAHGHLCKTPRLSWEERHKKVGFGVLYPELTPDVKSWCDYNVPGYQVRNNPAANFLIDLVFKSERDAALFKLFWF